MSLPLTIGVATQDELARVGALVVDTYVDGGYIAPDSPYLRSLRNVGDRWREADVLVARAPDDLVLGTVTFCLAGTPWAEISRPGEAEFRMLAVDPAVQGRGIGRALVQACLMRASAAGADATVISTTPRMVTAQRLYESMGFVRTPERDWSPRPGIDLLTYRWQEPR